MFGRGKSREIAPEPVAAEIIRSLRDEPDAWESNEYELRHKESGIAVWIANESYGIEVSGYRPEAASRREIKKAYGEWLVRRLRTRDTAHKEKSHAD